MKITKIPKKREGKKQQKGKKNKKDATCVSSIAHNP